MTLRAIFFTIVLLICGAAKAEPSIYVYNQSQAVKVFSDLEDVARPIASITKLMTAMVLLDQRSNLDDVLVLERATRGVLPRGKYTREDLLRAMLVKSDNAAAETLAVNYPGGREAFVAAMNAKAQWLGLTNTTFDDASGLSAKNQSTAKEVALLVMAAENYAMIREITVRHYASVEQKFPHRRLITVNNTNGMVLARYDNVALSKTGFTMPAGYCMGLMVQGYGDRYIIVVLGEKNKFSRLAQIRKIMQNYIM